MAPLSCLNGTCMWRDDQQRVIDWLFPSASWLLVPRENPRWVSLPFSPPHPRFLKSLYLDNRRSKSLLSQISRSTQIWIFKLSSIDRSCLLALLEAEFAKPLITKVIDISFILLLMKFHDFRLYIQELLFFKYSCCYSDDAWTIIDWFSFW